MHCYLPSPLTVPHRSRKEAHTLAKDATCLHACKREKNRSSLPKERLCQQKDLTSSASAAQRMPEEGQKNFSTSLSTDADPQGPLLKGTKLRRETVGKDFSAPEGFVPAFLSSQLVHHAHSKRPHAGERCCCFCWVKDSSHAHLVIYDSRLERERETWYLCTVGASKCFASVSHLLPRAGTLLPLSFEPKWIRV